MAEKGFKRKLTAILSADVKGFSRFMSEDETDEHAKTFCEITPPRFLTCR